jgi:hypothetical protein
MIGTENFYPQLNAERRQAMSYTISTLLSRNLQDVFGENDPARRRAAIDEIWTEDGVFYEPKTGVHRGRDEIDRVAGAIRATHPDFFISQLPSPRNWAMAAGSNGHRVAPAAERSRSRMNRTTLKHKQKEIESWSAS